MAVLEGEINNFIFVWSTVLVSVCYCHAAGKIFRQGVSRSLTILPVALLFFYLPLNLTSANLGCTTSFFIAWLSSFKLILFAFNKGPLASSSMTSIFRFVAVACLPIKLQSSSFNKEKPKKSAPSYWIKIALLGLCIKIYAYKRLIPQKVIWFFYCLHIYFTLEILLASVSAIARATIRVELEQPFNEPFLATSLQDFWGRRWNLMVSNILRPTVYDPVRSIADPVLGSDWAAIPAVLATFVVSGIMHELVFYNFGRLKPDGEVLCFFVLHGVALGVEIVVKKALKGRINGVPGIVSGPLTLGFVIYTSFWLFFPPFLRAKVEWKGCTEALAFIEFVKTGRLVSSSNFTCQFLL